MRNLKKLLAITLAMTLLVSVAGFAAAAPVSKEGWAYRDAAALDTFVTEYTELGIPGVPDKLQYVIDLGILGGASGDGVTNFNPNEVLPRWQYIRMYVDMYFGGQINPQMLAAYKEMPTLWNDYGPNTPVSGSQYAYIRLGADLGLVSYNEDISASRFNPNSPTTLNTALIAALKLQGASDARLAQWSADQGAFSQTALVATEWWGWGDSSSDFIWSLYTNAVAKGQIVGGGNNDPVITRGEAALMMATLLERRIISLRTGYMNPYVPEDYYYLDMSGLTYGLYKYNAKQVSFQVRGSQYFSVDDTYDTAFVNANYTSGSNAAASIRVKGLGDGDLIGWSSSGYDQTVQILAPTGWSNVDKLEATGGKVRAVVNFTRVWVMTSAGGGSNDLFPVLNEDTYSGSAANRIAAVSVLGQPKPYNRVDAATASSASGVTSFPGGRRADNGANGRQYINYVQNVDYNNPLSATYYDYYYYTGNNVDYAFRFTYNIAKITRSGNNSISMLDWKANTTGSTILTSFNNANTSVNLIWKNETGKTFDNSASLENTVFMYTGVSSNWAYTQNDVPLDNGSGTPSGINPQDRLNLNSMKVLFAYPVIEYEGSKLTGVSQDLPYSEINGVTMNYKNGVSGYVNTTGLSSTPNSVPVPETKLWMDGWQQDMVGYLKMKDTAVLYTFKAPGLAELLYAVQPPSGPAPAPDADYGIIIGYGLYRTYMDGSNLLYSYEIVTVDKDAKAHKFTVKEPGLTSEEKAKEAAEKWLKGTILDLSKLDGATETNLSYSAMRGTGAGNLNVADQPYNTEEFYGGRVTAIDQTSTGGTITFAVPAQYGSTSDELIVSFVAYTRIVVIEGPTEANCFLLNTKPTGPASTSGTQAWYLEQLKASNAGNSAAPKYNIIIRYQESTIAGQYLVTEIYFNRQLDVVNRWGFNLLPLPTIAVGTSGSLLAAQEGLTGTISSYNIAGGTVDIASTGIDTAYGASSAGLNVTMSGAGVIAGKYVTSAAGKLSVNLYSDVGTAGGTLTAAVTLSGDYRFVDGSASKTFVITVEGSTTQTEITITAPETITDNIAGALTVTGTGTVSVTGNVTGDLSNTAATLTVTGNVGSSTSTITVVSGTVTIGGNAAGSGAITLTTGSLEIAGTLGGTLTINGGTWIARDGQAATQGGACTIDLRKITKGGTTGAITTAGSNAITFVAIDVTGGTAYTADTYAAATGGTIVGITSATVTHTYDITLDTDQPTFGSGSVTGFALTSTAAGSITVAYTNNAT